MFCSWDIHFFYVLEQFMNFKSCDVMISINMLGGKHFWIYLLNPKSLSHETRPAKNYSKGQYF